MFRHLSIAIALACLIATPTQAGESHNSEIGFSTSNLIKSNLNVGRVAVEIYAADQVDVASLLTDLDLSKSASAQAIADRVNERRKLLYPDEEIILAITPPQDSRAAGAQEKAALVKALYWWNNTNCSTCYWFAQYTSNIATLFVDDVEYGAYDIYDKVGSGNWIYRYRTGEGSASTRYSLGARTTRGFRGNAAGVASKADVIMYFFR